MSRIQAAFVLLRACVPPNGPHQEAQALEAILALGEETLSLLERFVIAHEKQADMLMFAAKAHEKSAGIS